MLRSMVRSCGMLAHYTTYITASLQHSLTTSMSSLTIHRATHHLQHTLCPGNRALFTQFSSLSFPRNSVLAGNTQTTFTSLTSKQSSALTVRPGLSVMPVRTVVKHSKLGKMKTVKAVAKRFRRTGSGKLKFWPPGNVHNLLSKSHSRKGRIRKARYVNKTQLKTLNKMLIGRWS